KTLRVKINKSLEEKNYLLGKYGKPQIDGEEVLKLALKCAEELKAYRCMDSSNIIYNALRSRKRVLFEGAQGTLLDLLHGTYPFVTSSATVSGSACIGSGIGPTDISKVIGIMKAYNTRVGSGPFPTELDNDVGEQIREAGAEFGSTTG